MPTDRFARHPDAQTFVRSPARSVHDRPRVLQPRLPCLTTQAQRGTETYTRLSEALNEIIELRIWSGIYFRAADEQSADLAKKVANWRRAHYFEMRH